MAGEILKEIESSKLGKFIATIQAKGQGDLHLVEDIESGFVRAFPSLQGWALASQEVAQAVADGVKEIDESSKAAEPEPTSAPVTASPDSPLAASGVAPSAVVAPATVPSPDLPSLGA